MPRTFSLLIAVILMLPLSARAADPAAFNILTPKEIADGWILLFDGKTTFGWTSPNDSKWTVVDGMLAPQKGKQGALVTTARFRDYTLQMEYRVGKEGKAAVFVNTEADFRAVDLEHNSVEGSAGMLPLRFQGNEWMRGEISVRHGEFTRARFTTVGRNKREEIREVTSSSHPPEGVARHIALAGNGVVFRKVMLRPEAMKPLFDGRGLDGWKKYEGDNARAKSQFAVSKGGYLSLKDGPGDLQTTGQYDNFILQLECKINGKNLNSGIFFRCLPGQYQMGYEAQIHNGFGPEKEYTIDVFDPKTNKLLEQKKERFTAIDYGTGAIYRRMPARFQMAQDNEWFVMTVVAQGNHFATWVNGIQVADWTDNRPLDENARAGSYLKKGPISIQGHDPTTDLFFRNLKIVELPKK